MAEILDEVKEEIRQENLENFWKENGTFIIVCVVSVILAVGGKSWWVHHQARISAERTVALYQVLEQQDDIAALESYVAKTDTDHKTIASFTAAGLAAENARDDIARDRAIGLYRALADDRGLAEYYRDLAVLLSVGVAMEKDIQNSDELMAQVKPLTDQGRPYRASALELLASLEAENENFESAIYYLNTILDLEQGVPPSLRARAETLKLYYDYQIAGGQSESEDF